MHIVSLLLKYGKSSCALISDLGGQFGGQILNLHQILYNISFRKDWGTSLKSPRHTLTVHHHVKNLVPNHGSDL